jgi:molybdenum cofactor cytidylyltransferase
MIDKHFLIAHSRSPDFLPSVVLLAAGQARRMGRAKLLLPWGETSVIGQQVHQWRHLGIKQVAVVYAPEDLALQTELGRLPVSASDQILNPQASRGMFSSIQCAAAWGGWQAGLTHMVVALGDQPHLRVDSLRTLLRFAADHPDRICQPSRFGHPRHPVILPASMLAQLADCRVATFKEFLQTKADCISVCELDDPGLDFDLDTPADYERALSQFRKPT